MTPGTPTPENKPADSAPVKKTKLYWITGIGVLLFAAAIFFYTRGANNNNEVPAPELKKEPLFHRDEPTEKQIFQDDYKEKVREMLDSGKSVMEISKETKIRIDEVKKIRKQYKEEKAGK